MPKDKDDPEGYVTSGIKAGDRYFDQRVTSHGQSGGITAHTVHLGPRRFELTDDAKDLVVRALRSAPKLPVKLLSVGGSRSIQIAAELSNFLSLQGFEVLPDVESVIMLFPPLETPLRLEETAENLIVTVDASIPVS